MKETFVMGNDGKEWTQGRVEAVRSDNAIRVRTSDARTVDIPGSRSFVVGESVWIRFDDTFVTEAQKGRWLVERDLLVAGNAPRPPGIATRGT
jgi:hypothetical protein